MTDAEGLTIALNEVDRLRAQVAALESERDRLREEVAAMAKEDMRALTAEMAARQAAEAERDRVVQGKEDALQLADALTHRVDAAEAERDAAKKERDELAASWSAIAEGERKDLLRVMAERDHLREKLAKASGCAEDNTRWRLAAEADRDRIRREAVEVLQEVLNCSPSDDPKRYARAGLADLQVR